MSTEMKILILKRLFLQKDIITTQGNEKEKKDVWRNLYNSLENKLNIESPSALRGTFRIWKQRSLKKRDNPMEETITDSDKLIFKIFNLDPPAPNSSIANDVDDHDSSDEDNGNRDVADGQNNKSKNVSKSDDTMKSSSVDASLLSTLRLLASLDTGTFDEEDHL